jgi:hypothetical protein
MKSFCHHQNFLNLKEKRRNLKRKPNRRLNRCKNRKKQRGKISNIAKSKITSGIISINSKVTKFKVLTLKALINIPFLFIGLFSMRNFSKSIANMRKKYTIKNENVPK